MISLTADFKIYEDAYVHGGRWLRDIQDMDTCMYACINMGGECGAADWDPATQVCYVHEEKTTKRQLIRKEGVKHGVKCKCVQNVKKDTKKEKGHSNLFCNGDCLVNNIAESGL